MSFVAGAVVRIHPSHVLPGTIIQYSQSSGYMELLASGNPLVQLDEGDQMIYAPVMEMRSRVAWGNSSYNQLPSSSIMMRQIQTPTYMMRNRAEYDHHDTARAAAWNVNLPEAYRLANRQAHFQMLRSSGLYGFNPAQGEGIVNAVGATTVSLPMDSNGNTTLTTYDNGQLAIFFLTVIQTAMSRVFNFGVHNRVEILGPQRIIAPMMMQNIVQLTQFQRPGGGTTTTVGMIDAAAKDAGDGFDIGWGFDDTLQGKGAGGTDAVLIVIPELVKQPGRRYDTNEFAKLAPNLSANTFQFTDMAAPREIPTPIPGGAVDVVAEMRASSGWVVRPEAVTIVSITPS